MSSGTNKGRNPYGNLAEFQFDELGALIQALPLGARGSFGENIANPHTPVIAITFAYNINTDIVTTTTANGGGVTYSTGHAVVSSGSSANGSAVLESLDSVRYIPGQGVTARFTARFSTPRANAWQIIGIGDAVDGFFFGYDDTSFGVLRRVSGVDNWVYQADWSHPTTRYTLDPSKGNVFQIRYQWLGYGAIEFFIEDPESGQLALVHRISYANANTSTSVRNPSFPLHVECVNSGNTTPVTISTPSMGVYVQGPEFTGGLARFTSATFTGVGTTETPLFSIRNETTFQSITNRVRAIVDYVSVANTSAPATNDVIIAIRAGASGLSPAPTWTAYSANTSVCSLSTNSTSMTPGSGTLLYQFPVDTTAPYSEFVRPANIFFRPGTIITVSATGAAINAAGRVFLRWLEQF